MKNVLSLSALLPALAIPTVASAQESDWSGPYAGITVGMVATSTQNVDNWCWGACDAPHIQTVKPSVGGTLGLNAEVDSNLVVGIEADFDTAGSKTVQTPSYGNNVPATVYLWSADYKWTSSVRARAGMKMGKTMAYVTGGLALAKADFTQDSQNVPPWLGHPGPYGATWKGTLTGYRYGFGIEHNLGKFSAKVEVLHSAYGNPSTCFVDTVGPTSGQCILAYSPTEPSTLAFVPQATNIRLGINYRF